MKKIQYNINMNQNVQIALSVTVIGVLYMIYTKYTEFTNRQERLESNLRNVINAVNQHYLSQFEEEDVPQDQDQSVAREYQDQDQDQDVSHETDIKQIHEPQVRKQVVFVESDDDSDDEVLPSCVIEENEENYEEENSSDSSGPLLITKNSHCVYLIGMGKNKGSRCGKKTASDGYCKLHVKHVPTPM
jgi:hypothetical protein